MTSNSPKWLAKGLAYTEIFRQEIDDHGAEQRAAEEEIAAQLFSANYLLASIIGHARFTYSCTLRHFPLPATLDLAEENQVVVELADCLYRWQNELKQMSRPTQEEAAAVSTEVLLLALSLLHPCWITEAVVSGAEENAQRQPLVLPAEELLKLTPKTVGVHAIHITIPEIFQVIDQHEDPDALFRFRVVLPDAEHEYQVFPLAGGLLRIFDFRSLGITLLVASGDGNGGRAFAMKSPDAPLRSSFPATGA